MSEYSELDQQRTNMVPESVLIDPKVGETGEDPVSLLVYLLGVTQFRTAMVVLVLVVRAGGEWR